jgi:hypothetical protein
MCIYTDGEEESNLQWFSTEGRPLFPGGTIDAEIESDGDIFDEAEYFEFDVELTRSSCSSTSPPTAEPISSKVAFAFPIRG